MNEGDDFCMALTRNTPVRNVFNNKLGQAICVFAVKDCHTHTIHAGIDSLPVDFEGVVSSTSNLFECIKVAQQNKHSVLARRSSLFGLLCRTGLFHFKRI